MLNTLETTIYQWIRQRRLPAARLQNRFRFNRAELLEWATSHHLEILPDLVSPEHRAAAGPLLSQALEAGGIFRRVPAKDAPSLLRAAVSVVPLPASANRDFLADVLLTQAATGGMAIAKGIAMPHVRHPMVLPLDQPQASLHFLDRPLDLDVRDGTPVFALFLLMTPTVRAHLHLLAQLSFILADGDFRAVLERGGPREEILNAIRRLEGLQGYSRTHAPS